MLYKAGGASLLADSIAGGDTNTYGPNRVSARASEKAGCQLHTLPVLTRDWKQNREKREHKVDCRWTAIQKIGLLCKQQGDRKNAGPKQIEKPQNPADRFLGESHEERAADKRWEAERPVCSFLSFYGCKTERCERATDPIGDARKSGVDSSDVVNPRRCSAGARKAAKFCENELATSVDIRS